MRASAYLFSWLVGTVLLLSPIFAGASSTTGGETGVWGSTTGAPPPDGTGRIDGDSPPKPARIRVHGREALTLHAPLGDASASQRAQSTARILEEILATPKEEGTEDRVSIEPHAGQFVLSLGTKRILTLSALDAAAANAPNPRDHAETVRHQIEEFLQEERSRQALSNTVLSWSFVVFFGFIAFLILPRLSRSTHQAREWVHHHHDRVPNFHIRDFEVISKGGVQNTVMILVSAVGFLLQAAVVYVYLVVCLGLFETTSSWVPHLNSFLTSPVRTLAVRLAEVFPVAALTVVIVLLVVLAYRITGQIFDSIGEGDLELSWVPRHNSHHFKHIFQLAIVVGSLLLLGPLVSENADSVVGRVGMVALGVIGVGSIPMTVSFFWGFILIVRQSYRRGSWLECDKVSGYIEDITLLEVVLRKEDEGSPLIHHVPHLWTAFHPVTVSPKRPPVELTVSIPFERHRPATSQQFTRAAQKLHPDAKVEVTKIEAVAIHYQVTFPNDRKASPHEVLSALLATVQEGKKSE